MIKQSRGKGKKPKVLTEQDKRKQVMSAIRDLGRERNIEPEVLFEAIEAGLINAYKKNFNAAQNVRVAIDRETCEYHVYALKTAVESVSDPVLEIALAEAKARNESYELGDVLEVEVTPANFGRVAAQLAKNVVVQRIREAERSHVYNEYSSRDGKIVTGTVSRVEGSNVFMDLGKAEALLAPAEQISGEEYLVGDRLKAYVLDVKRTPKGTQINVSRTHPGLLRRLFELEVPEMKEGIVEIKSAAREPGMRSKIAVYSNEADVDCIGACVGTRGTRVQAIADELRNEKIDIVKWNEEPRVYIANALSPAKVVEVGVNESTRVARVIVPDYQLSLAIGKEGQNARLAAKLTGWKIDIRSETQAQLEPVDPAMEFMVVPNEYSYSV